MYSMPRLEWLYEAFMTRQDQNDSTKHSRQETPEGDDKRNQQELTVQQRNGMEWNTFGFKERSEYEDLNREVDPDISGNKDFNNIEKEENNSESEARLNDRR